MDVIDQLAENRSDGPAAPLALGQMEKLLDVPAQTDGIANSHPRKCAPHIPGLVEIMRIAGEDVNQRASPGDRQPEVFLEIVKVERFQ